MIVRDVMTENPRVVSPMTTVGDVAEVFRDLEIRHLPVVEGETLVGIVSDRDLKSVLMPRLVDQEAIDQLRARFDAPIASLMTSDVVSVNAEAELGEVAELMIEHKIGAVPVVDAGDGHLEGIVSYVDVLRAVQSRLEG